MPRYRLRTLLIVLAVVPLILAWWFIGDFDNLRFGPPRPVRGSMWTNGKTCELNHVIAFQRRNPVTNASDTIVMASSQPLDANLIRQRARNGLGGPAPAIELWSQRQPLLLLDFNVVGELEEVMVWDKGYRPKVKVADVRFEGNRIIGKAKYQEANTGFRAAFDTPIEQF